MVNKVRTKAHVGTMRFTRRRKNCFTGTLDFERIIVIKYPDITKKLQVLGFNTIYA